MLKNQEKNRLQKLEEWHIHLDGDWHADEVKRVWSIFENLSKRINLEFIHKIFNDQITTLHHSGRPGKAGRTRAGDIFLDEQWTDWTLAHELGHRWNNAWNRLPEQILRLTTSAGRWEWLKRILRRFEKWLERLLKRFNFKGHIDWKSLWYAPGNAPPPCGIDRNFNASEDLAESFASLLLPGEAKERASKAAHQNKKFKNKWDWGSKFNHFVETPRGRTTLQTIKDLVTQDQHFNQPYSPTSEDQPRRV
jgi:hypothetical protein